MQQMQDKIFSIRSNEEFREAALELFRWQAERCAPYKQYIGLLGIDPQSINNIEQIPFLPIVVPACYPRAVKCGCWECSKGI